MYKIINIELNTKVNMYPELSKEHTIEQKYTILFYFIEILIVLFGKKKPKNSLKKHFQRKHLFTIK